MGVPGAGASASRVFVVTTSDTAAVLGSGRLAVLATPRLLAWFEQVAVGLVEGVPGRPPPMGGQSRSGESRSGESRSGESRSGESLSGGSPEAAEGVSTVGSHVELSHLAPTPVGGQVTVRAQVREVAGRQVELVARATDSSGRVIATAAMTRVVVDAGRFMSRLT